MKLLHATTLLLSLTPIASTFSWSQWLPEVDAMIVRRQDSDSTSSTAQETASQTSTAETTGSTRTSTDTDTTSATGTDTASDTATGTSDASGSATGTDKASSSGSKSSTSVNSGDAAGSAVMVTPTTSLTSALYKIGDYVTFGWNYTDLQVTPTAVDVVASCSTSSSTWTLTANMTFETKGDFTWDTGAFQSKAMANQQPLIVEQYTLYIYDAESSVTATAGAGELTANAALTFGLYTGQPYTALASGWVCATCSGALSHDEKQALGFALTMMGVTVLSFTWFVTGLW